MKATLIDIILASWLLILVDSSSYFPSETYISDGLPFQPFIPYFRGHTSKNRFYQTIRVNPEGSEGYGGSESPEGLGGFEYYERPKYPEHHKRGPCSIVNQAVDFCNDVMERLKSLKEKNDLLLAALKGCDQVETPIGTSCEADGNCYVVSEYYETTTTNMYEAYQRACPCPLEHFSTTAILSNPDISIPLITCLGQIATNNRIVLNVWPPSGTANQCSYIGHVSSGSFLDYQGLPVDCNPTSSQNYVFVCKASCV